jgi:hypothetical protein
VGFRETDRARFALLNRGGFGSIRSQRGELLVDDLPLGHQKADGLLA